ncbi:MAG: redoxin domain-containing protein [Candidatus Aminicenantes bacterium]|nr:redoxin domain-containing protein [Candidatus Aminicenantes bacterium]
MKKSALFIFSLILIFLSCAESGITENPGKEYPTAPGFTLQDLYGNEISLSDYEGKVVFLNFWATWCGPCRKEIPGFLEIYDQYKSKGMEIIGVSVDKTGPASVLNFSRQYKISYPVVMSTQKLERDYRPGQFIPTTFIIDKKGQIRHKHVGYMDKRTLKNYFLEIDAEG